MATVSQARRAAIPSLHERILGDIEGRILTGEWPPGVRIPFEHELSAQYQCSRMTVNKALSELAKAGLIERRRKVGSFVMRAPSRSAVLEIPDVKAEVGALGAAYRFEILTRRERRGIRADAGRLEGVEAGLSLP
ncbi:MAG TPA: GntR family transcriptional regulator, partial [Xanthobacteraceae bacterium]|nr:GntR family transcriptional regulator [Xanthobacteraceae bacterium]